MDVAEEAPGVFRIDHGWMGPGFIASYLLLGDGDPVLVEAGPASTLGTLLEGMRHLGVAPRSLGGLLLTHVHLDHAAGAGALARLAPGARVHVHPSGAPHLADPRRLLASAQRLYGDAMDALWGEMLPIASSRLRPLSDGEALAVAGRTLVSLHTPGHAGHHVAFHDPEAGIVFTGDVGGIRLEGARHVRPPTPPPELDTAAWTRSIERLRALAPRRLLLTHFGGVQDVEWHLDDLERRLLRWTGMAAARPDATSLAADLQQLEDAELARAGAGPPLVARYAESIPYPMLAAGLARQAAGRQTPPDAGRA
jgi:glyoxylase-like metal-dependent hydrolase (beta-lactamase superfamily II)